MTPAITVRGIRAEFRAARLRSRPAHARRERNDTIYLVALGIVGYGGVLVQAVRRMIAAPPVGPVPPSLPVAQWLFTGCAVLGLGLLVRALLVFGPVVASGPFQFWLLGTPLDRRGLLARRFWWLAVGATVVGGLTGLAVSALLRADLDGKLLSTSVCAGVTAGLVAVCVLLQQRGSSGHRLSTVLVVVGALVAATAVFVTPPAFDLPVLTAVVVLLPLFALVWAFRVLGTLNRATLAGGAEILAAGRVAANWMDVSLFSAVASARKWREVGKVNSRGLRGVRYQAMLFADLRRLSRNRSAYYRLIGLLLTPYAAQRLLPEAFVPTVQLVMCAVAVSPFAAGLRHICRSDTMRRALGGSDVRLRLIHLVVPAVMALLWTALTSPATGFALASVVVPVGAVAFVYRRASQPSFDYSGVAVDTPFGMVQPNMMRQLARGPLLLLLLAAVQFYL